MPACCFLNEEIKKLVVEVEDRQHYLTLAEADDFLARLEALLVGKEKRVTLPVHDRTYTVSREAAELLCTQAKAASAALEAQIGRPAPPVNVKAELDKLNTENETLKALVKSFEDKLAASGDKSGNKDPRSKA